MEPEEIIDEQTLERWLRGQDSAVVVAMAHRAAMRVAPFWFVAMEERWARDVKLTDLTVLRNLLTSSVAVVHAAPEFTLVAAAASFAYAADANIAADAFASSDSASLPPSSSSSFVRPSYASSSSAAAANTASSDGFAAYALLSLQTAGSALAYITDAKDIVWSQFCDDAAAGLSGLDLLKLPVWSKPAPNWFDKAQRVSRKRWSREPALWSFWARWWNGATTGAPLNWDLQRDIALIPDEDWKKGPAHMAELIAEIEEKYQPEAPDIDSHLRRLPPSPPELRKAFATAVWENRAALPATLDAILGYCALEIERLQSRNYRDEDDRIEAQRQIGVLLRLHDAAGRLAPMLITEKPMTETEAIVPEKLSRVMVKALQDWPRKNVDDLADTYWRMALTGASTGLMCMLSIPPSVAISVATAFFGGKKIADAIKAGGDSKNLN